MPPLEPSNVGIKLTIAPIGFNPIDLCLVTYCCPCVTFGKTHHRLRKDPNLAGYEPINTSVWPKNDLHLTSISTY
jgi:hypothetical protein